MFQLLEFRAKGLGIRELYPSPLPPSPISSKNAIGAKAGARSFIRAVILTASGELLRHPGIRGLGFRARV